MAKDAPVGFKNIRLQFTLDTDASEEQLATLLRLTERYCVVSDAGESTRFGGDSQTRSSAAAASGATEPQTMSSFVSDLGIGIVVFASTNIDDLFLLAAFFADPRLRHRSIVVGQYVGIGALVLVSALAALLALALPAGWVALLGVVPLFLGLSRLRALRGETLGDGSRQQRASHPGPGAQR